MGLFGVRDQSQARFHDDLATALDSGLPIRDALKTVAGDFALRAGGPFGAAPEIAEAIRGGTTFAEALDRHPAVFSPFERHVVAAGEKGGRLVESLRRLAQHFQRRGTLRDSVGYGLLYPAALVHLAFLLPPLFQLVQGGLLAYARAALVPIAILWAAVLGGGYVVRSLGATGLFDSLVLAIPWVGGTARIAAQLELVATLGALYGAGVPVVEALDATADAVRNRVIAETARRAREVVRDGGSLTEGFSLSRGALSPLLVDALRVGEASGKLEETLARLETQLAADLELRMRALAVALPVIAYLVVAAYIGWIVVSFYANLYSGIGEYAR